MRRVPTYVLFIILAGVLLLAIFGTVWYFRSHSAAIPAPTPTALPSPTPSLIPTATFVPTLAPTFTAVFTPTLPPPTSTATPLPTLTFTPTLAACLPDQIKYFPSDSFELWPTDATPSKGHWQSWPDGTLVIHQGNDPKGPLPLGLVYDNGTKTYTVNHAQPYIVEWWVPGTKDVEGIFTNTGVTDPSKLEVTMGRLTTKMIVYHFWVGGFSADCRYDGDRVVAFLDIPVWPLGNTLDQLLALGVPTDSHLIQYLLKNKAIGDMETRPELITP